MKGGRSVRAGSTTCPSGPGESSCLCFHVFHVPDVYGRPSAATLEKRLLTTLVAADISATGGQVSQPASQGTAPSAVNPSVPS